MIYREEQRDLFSMPSNYYFVQCISADFAMGAGIAAEFNKHFDVKNRTMRLYRKNIWRNNGWVTDLTPEVPVYNLVTKGKYYEKPTYENLRAALTQLLSIPSFKENVTKLAMPKIGCGLDGLDWNIVSEIVKDVFKDTNIEIVVCYL